MDASTAYALFLLGAFLVGWVFPILLSIIALLVVAAIVCWAVRLILRAREA